MQMQNRRRLLSRFMRKTLLPDEAVVREGRFPLMYTISCWFALAAFTATGLAAQYAMARYGQPYAWVPAVAGLGIGLWQFSWMMLKKLTTEIVLTDQRLIYKTGFFLITVQEVDTEQLASDHVTQSLIGRIMDYGELHVRCIEASDFRLPAIGQPYEFRNEIEKQKRKYRDDYMKVERLRRHGDG